MKNAGREGFVMPFRTVIPQKMNKEWRLTTEEAISIQKVSKHSDPL